VYRKLITLFIGILPCLFMVTESARGDLILAEGQPTGQWWNPARDGEGFYVETIDTGGVLQVAVAMYSYDSAGNQLWLVGNVAIDADDIGATVPVFLIDGPVWGVGYDPADKNTTQFGTIVVRFPSCDTALFNVQSNVQDLESGSYSLVRATSVIGLDCTDPPPEQEGQVTSGRWTGSGVCFFVNEEGTKIVESDLCPNGKSFSAEIPGIEIDIDEEIKADCLVNVACDAAWDIFYGDNVSANCVNEVGGIAKIYFNSATAATVEVLESTNLNGSVCVGGSTAAPEQ